MIQFDGEAYLAALDALPADLQGWAYGYEIDPYMRAVFGPVHRDIINNVLDGLN